MAEIKRARRYYLHKRRKDYADGNDNHIVWQSKQAAEEGADLPAAFPHLAQLATAFYTTVEDLDGSDEDELRDAGLTSRQATAVLAALTPLL